jgi:hypothetical protein
MSVAYGGLQFDDEYMIGGPRRFDQMVGKDDIRNKMSRSRHRVYQFAAMRHGRCGRTENYRNSIRTIQEHASQLQIEDTRHRS